MAASAAGALALLACGGNAKPAQTPAAAIAPVQQTPHMALFVASDGYDIATADGRGKHLRTLSGKSRKGTVIPHLFPRPSWSPDGRRIAFEGVRHGDPAGFRADIYIMKADGSDQRKVTTSGDGLGPVWSPDGRTIVFTRLRLTGSTLTGSLWAIGPDRKELRQLTDAESGQTEYASSFSPDGTRLAITRTTCAPPEDGGCLSSRSAVYLAAADGSDERKLIDRAAGPAFSPDGTRIAFVSDRDENGKLSYGDREFFASELYVMSADGDEQKRLTQTRDLNEASPSWIPEGTRIAFQRGKVIDNAEGMSIFQINADGTCERRLLADRRLDTWYASPSWRPGKARRTGGFLSCR